MTPVWYLGISPLQEPFDLGLDEAKRQQCAFNMLALKRPSATFLREVISALVGAGVGTEGESIFATASAVIPSGTGPYLGIRATGGAPPIGTHNEGVGALRRPGIQIIVRASTWAAAEAMAQAAYSALVAVRNREVA
jgi:hypothetical protein